jgi:type I restriction-modification system DNA methylase subunit
MKNNIELIEKLRNWDADCVIRNSKRIKKTGEVFTPNALVIDILNKINIEEFKDKTKTFIDPCCGIGQFLSEVIIKKLENGSTFKDALSTVYGIDIMLDNVDVCRERLLCGVEKYRYIVEKNIVYGDALNFNYDSFDKSV